VIRRAADERPDAGDELVQVERLREIVVGAEVEIGNLIGRRIASGEDQDRSGLCLAQLAEHLAALHAGEHQVENNGVIVSLLGLPQPLLAVGGRVDGEA
jgi:hypothetical protein